MGGWIGKSMHAWMDRWMNGGWIDLGGWVNGWVDWLILSGWVDVYTNG